MRAIRSATLLAMSLGLAACAVPEVLPQPTAVAVFEPSARLSGPTQILGHAALDGPLVGAEVRLLGPGGEVLHQGSKTGANGAFVLPVLADHPALMRVELRLGEADGKPFAGVLMADFRADDPGLLSAHVNLVTTLAARFRELKALPDPLQADAKVKRFLNLPSQGVDLGYGLSNPRQQLFDHKAFQMALGGDVDAGLHLMAAQVDRPSAGRSFPKGDRKLMQAGAVASAVLGTVASGIGNGALAYVGGQAMGWVCGKIFGAPKDPNDARYAQITKDLAAQKEVLDQLSASMGQVSQQLDAVNSQLRGLSAQVRQANDLAAYDGVANTLSVPRSNVQALTNRLAVLASLNAEQVALVQPSTLEDFRSNVRNSAAAYQDLVHKQQVGGNGLRSGVALFHQARMAIAPGYPWGISSGVLNDLQAQFEDQRAESLKATLLLAEVAHLGDPLDQGVFNQANAAMEPNRLSELALVYGSGARVPAATVVAPAFGLMFSGRWARNSQENLSQAYQGPWAPGVFPTQQALMQGYAGFQDWQVAQLYQLFTLRQEPSYGEGGIISVDNLRAYGFDFPATVKTITSSSPTQDGSWFGLLLPADTKQFIDYVPMDAFNGTNTVLLGVRAFPVDAAARQRLGVPADWESQAKAVNYN